ncbi:alpha/beta hydrolase [Rhizobium sp. BE258]|uniref:alpha/beta fold hydrolase n=1 Tax=Rhizobium sp. BE258 TaxID=2817722 RepID=UPI00285690CA|nr:alpha/beta hydrolase [Rhizobium sp. BE258]MDR7144813.1 pimeloyl-ACP methyl ester carboxylesterase [Rhizobium sp. BE258]
MSTLFTQTQFIETEGGRVAFEDTGGNGSIILAIPGMGDLRSEYRYLNPMMQQAGYRVITMDARGYGETTAKWSDYSARAVGRDAVAVLKKLGAGSATILGNSFAAGSALWAAQDAPEQVNGVVLLGPIVRDLEVSFVQKLALGIGFAGPWRVGFWTMYWDSLFPTKKPADHIEVKAAITRNLQEPARMDALRAMINLSKADTAAILEKTKVPALIVMGTKDPDFKDAAAEAHTLARKLNAETMIVEGAGHYPHTEMAEQVTPRILSFVRSLAGSGSKATLRVVA